MTKDNFLEFIVSSSEQIAAGPARTEARALKEAEKLVAAWWPDHVAPLNPHKIPRVPDSPEDLEILRKAGVIYALIGASAGLDASSETAHLSPFQEFVLSARFWLENAVADTAWGLISPNVGGQNRRPRKQDWDAR